METKINVLQRDSSGYRLRELPMLAQMKVDELVELFLAADFKTQDKILNKLRNK